jgi:glutamyl-tRNA reductase
MDRMEEAISASDLVLVATGAPHTVLHKPAIMRAMKVRPDRKLLVIDVSIPHNVDQDIVEVENVELDNMDSLETIAQQNVKRRMSEINSAEKIIAQELEKMDSERREEAANEIIRLIGMKLASIREKELETAVSRSGTADTQTLLDDMSRALVNKITADLYVNLRKASREGDLAACNTLAIMFGLR